MLDLLYIIYFNLDYIIKFVDSLFPHNMCNCIYFGITLPMYQGCGSGCIIPVSGTHLRKKNPDPDPP